MLQLESLESHKENWKASTSSTSSTTSNKWESHKENWKTKIKYFVIETNTTNLIKRIESELLIKTIIIKYEDESHKENWKQRACGSRQDTAYKNLIKRIERSTLVQYGLIQCMESHKENWKQENSFPCTPSFFFRIS